MLKNILSLFLILVLITTSFTYVNLASAGLSEAVAYLKSQTPDAWITMALAAAGESGLDLSHLEEVSGTKATDYERTILALTAVGEDPRTFGSEDLVATLKNNFYLDSQIGDVQLLNDDFFGILALVSAGEAPQSQIIQDSKNYILSHQNSDGGWGYATGASSDTNDTAVAIMALLETGLTASDSVLTEAVTYLQSQQNNDGGFAFTSGAVSDSGSDSWVISAIYKLDQDPEDWVKNENNPLAHLESLQLPDGSFKWQAQDTQGSTVLTAYAVVALSGRFFPVDRIVPGNDPVADVFEVSFRIEGSTETICQGNSPADDPLTLIEVEAADCGYAYEIIESAYGEYLSKINSDEAVGLSGWLYLVNWSLPSIGARDYELEDADQVLWYFGEYGWQPTRLSLNKTQVNPGEEVEILVEYYEGNSWLPLAGAEVVIEGLGVSVGGFSDSQGKARVSTSQVGSYKVFAEKDGFIRSNSKTFVVGTYSQEVNLKVVIAQPSGPEEPEEPEISFTVSGGQIDFGTLKPGESATTPITLTNTGQVDVYVEGVVEGDNLFVENLYLEQGTWPNFNTVIESPLSEEIDVSLVVPSNYTGEGEKEADLTFWAVVED